MNFPKQKIKIIMISLLLTLKNGKMVLFLSYKLYSVVQKPGKVISLTFVVFLLKTSGSKQSNHKYIYVHSFS